MSRHGSKVGSTDGLTRHYLVFSGATKSLCGIRPTRGILTRSIEAVTCKRCLHRASTRKGMFK